VGPDGDLYLRGGGDVTFGTASFARRACGSHASLERLAYRLQRVFDRRSAVHREQHERLARESSLLGGDFSRQVDDRVQGNAEDLLGIAGTSGADGYCQQDS
jgi:hypothetical protein